jgi:hypothetical protein
VEERPSSQPPGISAYDPTRTLSPWSARGRGAHALSRSVNELAARTGWTVLTLRPRLLGQGAYSRRLVDATSHRESSMTKQRLLPCGGFSECPLLMLWTAPSTGTSVPWLWGAAYRSLKWYRQHRGAVGTLVAYGAGSTRWKSNPAHPRVSVIDAWSPACRRDRSPQPTRPQGRYPLVAGPHRGCR